MSMQREAMIRALANQRIDRDGMKESPAMAEATAIVAGAQAKRDGIRFHDNPFRQGPPAPTDWLYGAWEFGYIRADGVSPVATSYRAGMVALMAASNRAMGMSDGAALAEAEAAMCGAEAARAHVPQAACPYRVKSDSRYSLALLQGWMRGWESAATLLPVVSE